MDFIQAQADIIPAQEDLDRIADSLSPVHTDWVSIIVAIVVLLLSIFGARLARRAIRRVGDRAEVGSPDLFHLGARVASYVIVGAGVLGALRVVGIDLVPLVAGLGLTVIVLAVAARPFLENFAAGLTLQMQRPMEAGDQVDIDGVQGTVVEMASRTVILQRMDGTVAHIPNQYALDHTLINMTAGGVRRTSIDVGLAYGTDLDDAARVIVDAVQRTPGVRAEPTPEALVHEFGDSTINAAIRFWHDPEIRSGWMTRHDVALNVKRALDANGIKIAFPQRVIWQADSVHSGDGTDS